MADLFRARDLQTSEAVAIKVMRGNSGDAIARFEREAKLIAALEHPAIVGYRGHGQAAGGEYYLALEWLEGEDLAQRLGQGELTTEEAMRLVARVAEGLELAHRVGVVHRDIKPSNLFLPDGDVGKVKLIDFGIAGLTQGQTIETDPSMTLGSPGYMAPEQAQTGKRVGKLADIYALGCVLFRCLTGRRPLEGDSAMAVMLKTVMETPPRLRELRPDVPLALDDLVASMLAKKVEYRPASAAELVANLESIAPTSPRSAGVSKWASSLTQSEQRIISVALMDISFWAETGQIARLGTDDRHLRYDALAALVPEFGGVLHRLSDGMVAVTLEGIAADEQATRVARCALAIHDAVVGTPIALATGRGNVTPLPVGDVIDRAVALLQRVRRARSKRPDARAEMGVRIDQATAGLLGARFRIVWDKIGAVLRAERTVEAARTLLGRPTQFVGRARELGILNAIMGATMSESRANVAVVVGEAGRGKSRLRHEFLRTLRRHPRAIEVLSGRGDPIAAGSPFSTIAPAIRRAAGFMPTDTEADRLSKLYERLERRLSGESLGRAWNFLGELVGLRSPTRTDIKLRAARADPILMGDQMKRAWLEWLGAELDAQPVVLVLEDLHWGDRPSMQFVSEALRLFEDKQLMVLALGRPELHRDFPHLWQEHQVTAIDLPVLSSSASARLVRGVLGAKTSNDIVGQIVQQAEGNAFYLEELIRDVAEGRKQWPETVLAMAQARLEDIDSENRMVLRGASIFGTVFTPDGVRALLGGPGQAPMVMGRLLDLAKRELITASQIDDDPQAVSFTFRHALLRDAVYAMLTDEDRELGHRLAGEWLEEQPDSDSFALAAHFERGKRGDRAAYWYARAAEQALEGNDFAATVARCKLGLACTQDGEARGELAAIEAEAHRWQGHHTDTLGCATLAMKLLPSGSRRWFHAAGLAAIAAGNTKEGDHLVNVANELAVATPVDGAVGAFLCALSRAGDRLLLTGRIPQADPLLVRMREYVDHPAAREPAVSGWMHRIRAWYGMSRGDTGTCIVEMTAAAEQFAAAGDTRNAVLQRGNAGFAHLHAGDSERAVAILTRTRDAAIANDLKNVRTSVEVDLGLALARLGRLDNAISLLETVSERCTRQGIVRLAASGRSYLAQALSWRGALADAESQAHLAVDVSRDHGPTRMLALAVLGDIRLKRGAPDDALKHANRAMAQLQIIGEAWEGESLVRLVYAQALAAVGQDKAARDALTAAHNRLQERADMCRDPAAREQFLRGIPANAETLALAEQVLN